MIRAHEMQGHMGKGQTAEDHVARCIPCLAHKRKSGKEPGLLREIPTSQEPMCWIHCDHVGPYPNSFSKCTHVRVIADRLTEFVYLEAVRGTSAERIIAALEKFMADWGVPAHLTSDRETAFTAKSFQKFIL